MADPTLGLTFSDFQIRVAEFLGMAYYGSNGQGAAQVPINTQDLDLVTRLVNDGYRRFIGENPKWIFLNVPITITFNTAPFQSLVTATGTNAGSGGTITWTDSSIAGVYADNFWAGQGGQITHIDTSLDEFLVTASVGATGAFTGTVAPNMPGEVPQVSESYVLAPYPVVAGQQWRYYMPDDFYGELLTPWTYNIGGPRLTVTTVSEYEIRELRAGANTTGTVSNCAFRPINTMATWPFGASTGGQRWEALFWPSPATTNTLTAIYKRFPQKLANATDRSVAGYQHDDTIMQAIIAEAERQRGDTAGPREAGYQTALKRSLAVDARAAVSKVSGYGDRSEDRVPFGRRPMSYYGVSTYNGARIP